MFDPKLLKTTLVLSRFSLIYVATAYSLTWGSEVGLIRKHSPSMNWLARNRHSNLIVRCVSDEEKNFIK
jgi:hypothetical protein